MDAAAETAEGKRTAAARSSVAPTLAAAVGSAALVVLVIVTIAGGFTVDAGPLHVSAHNWRPPLLVALLACIAGIACGRAAFAAAAAESWSFIDRHAFAVAIVIAAAAAGVGIAYGTQSASSSYASGYVSESRLLVSGRLDDEEPIARLVAWPNATWAFAPLGYRPGRERGELVPTYPAGLPLVLAAARLVGGELAVFLVVPFLGAAAVLATYGIGARLQSRTAGIAAALFLATSPIALFQIVQPMSDVAVTAWWALALVLALSPVRSGPIAAGAASGLAVLTRPNLLPFALVIALAVSNYPRGHQERRRRLDRLKGFAAGMLPAVGAQFLMQWRLYGSPFTSGYGSAGELYAFSSILPNAIGYARRLVHGEGPAIAAGLMAITILALARRRADIPPLKRLMVLATTAFVVVLVSYLPYAVLAEWSYLRFLLPAFPLVFVLIGALMTGALLKLPAPIRVVVWLTALAAVASVNVLRAQDEQAFAMYRYESRYRLAGLYLASAVPDNTVIVTSQESGSARYYTKLPILRWDQLDVDLDMAVAALRASRRHPVLLVEDWEAPQIAKKHPRSVNARLDWQPRSEFGDETRVFLYDPADRGAHRSWPADRVH